MKKIVKVLAWVLCFALIVPEFSVPVFAAEVQEISQSETSEEGTEEDSEEQTVDEGVSSENEPDTEVEVATEETPMPTEEPENSDESTATSEETTDVFVEEETEEERSEENTGEENGEAVLPDETPVEVGENGFVEDEGTEEVIEQNEAIIDDFIIDNVQSSGTWFWPVPGHSGISQYYSDKHKAIDITAALGTPIYATKSGTVRLAINNCSHEKVGDNVCVHNVNGYDYWDGGNQVYITHDDGTHSVYAHMIKGSVSVSAGQRVSAGQQIGKMGQSGYSTGVHLHFGVSIGGDRYYAGTITNPMSLTYGNSGGISTSLLSNTGVNEITNTTAKINATLPAIYNISEAGFYYGTSPDNMTKVVESTSGNTLTAFYTLGNGKWCGPLSPGTTYYYKIYVIINGVTHETSVDSFRTTGIATNPYGNVDDINSGVGYIDVSGWCIDDDVPTQALEIHVYIGNSFASTFMANGHRADVGSAYPGAGNYHGFERRIYTDKIGEQKISVYAINIGNGDTNTLIGEKVVNILADTEAPIVTNAYISQYDKDGYTVVANVSDNAGIQKVEFPTWHEGQTVSDVKWYPGTLNADGSYSYRVNVADFDNWEGIYHTHVYAWDMSSHASVEPYRLEQVIDRTAPTGSNVKTERISDDVVKVSCEVIDATGVERVVFPTWTDYNGQDDIAEDWYNNCKGTKEGNRWVWYVYDSQHNYEKGNYITHIYAYDTYGNGGFDGGYIGGIGYSFANRFQPTEFIYDGHKYEVYNDLLSWSEAKVKCEELGGHLVTITSQGEQDAVTQALQSEPRLSYFIGGQAVNGNPTWITGEKFEYSNWYPGEPNNWSGVENVYQMYKDAGKWNDVVDAKDSIGFICEYEPQKEEVIPPQDEDDDTPSSGEDNTNDPTEDEPEGFWVEDIGDYTYTGKAIKPTVKVYDGTTLLKEKKDYTVAYKNNTKANDASKPKTAPTITVTGKGNYSGSHTIYFIIEPVDIAGDDFTVDNMTVTYTGKKQTPTPTLKWKGKKLEYGKDFYVPEYNNAKNDSRAFKTADTYNLTVVGKKNFAGEIPITLTISASKKQIAMNKVTVKGIKDVSWSGKQQTQTGYKVSYKKDVLSEENGDYTVTWGTNTDVGTGTVTFTGTGLDTDGDGYSYIGTKTVSFKINGTSMSNVTISGINKKYTYTGDEIKPAGTLAYKPKKADPITLIEGTHYTVSYKNNLDKGTATISYKGLASGGFTGTKKVTFEIKAKGIATKIEGDTFIKQIEVTFVDTECMQQGIYFAPYMKGGAKPEVIVTCGDKTLTKGKDYTISYENNKKIALSVYEPKPAVVIKGKGNYSGTEREYFWIRGKQMSNGFGITVVAADKAESTKKNGYRQSFKVYDADGTALGSKDYDTQNVTYTLIQTESEDGTITDVNKVLDKNSVVPANSIIQITVKGKGAYAGGEATGTYRILEKGYNISKATIQIKNQTYTGGQIQITDQSQFKSGKVYLMVGKEKKELVLGKEIEVVPGSYIKNVKAGTAKVTFRGINDFGGTKTVSFKIKSKKFLWW